MAARLIRLGLAVVAVALAVWQAHLLAAVLRGGSDALAVETALVENGPFVVGVTREGKLASADVVSVDAPRIHSNLTLTWVIDDGSEVEEGDLVARIDLSQYEFEVEQQRLDYQKARTRIDQERRERTRDYETAQMDVDTGLGRMKMLGESHRTELEKGGAQVGHDQWRVAWSQEDYDRKAELEDVGIVPQTEVEQAERVVRSSEHALTKSERDVSYMGAEHKTETAQAQTDIDTAEFEAGVSERRIGEAVESAEESADRSKRRLDEMEEQLAAGELRAPKAGVVVLVQRWSPEGVRAIKEGDRLWYGRKICEIADLENLEVRVRVDEEAASGLRVGQEAVVTAEGAPEREFLGEMTAMGAVAREVDFWDDANAIPGQRVFDVTVKVHEPDLALLRPGATAEVQFVAERMEQAIYVPVEAVFEKPEGQVAYVRRGDRFAARKVKTGQRNDEAVVVLEGLKAGERVALGDPTRREAS
jgi:RND family efflux transporter MFP subunit